MTAGEAPKLGRVIETSLYVDDLDRAAAFYEDVLGLAALTSDKRFRAYDVGGANVLLLFRRGATLETVRMPGGTIPPHDGHGPLHIAFAVAADELPQWEKRLGERRHRDRRPHRLVARRPQHLFPRSGRPSAGTGDAGAVGDLLGQLGRTAGPHHGIHPMIRATPKLGLHRPNSLLF